MCTGCRNPDLAGGGGADLLLELAAAGDLAAFQAAVEGGCHVSETAAWYGRSSGGRSMALRRRSPLMIAALYGHAAVVEYILATCPAEAERRSPTDAATALHCAASGGAGGCAAAADLLVAAGADVDALDLDGRRPADVIARNSPKSLEIVLKAAPSPPKARVSSPEKKEYPPDLTLPDIKNGIYSTDEFRMYTFKVKPCSRAYSHDWTECPFVHPGENARRRDPRKFSYSCVPCPEFRKGSCRNGDNCEYAHGVFECWLHPAQYRTRLCKDEVGCNRRVCFFAHRAEELRQVNPSAASVAGVVLPSPRSSSPGLSPLDMATALMLMQQQQPNTPLSPSGSGANSAWMSPSVGTPPPSLQLPASRLKASLSARDMEVDLDMLEGYRRRLMDDVSGSPQGNWGSNGGRGSDYSDLLGSVDSSLLNQLQGLSVKQQPPQFQSPNGVKMQQSSLLSGYGGSLSSSPPVSAAASSFGTDHSMAKAIMNSRAAAFAKRSQSFIDRGSVPGRQSTLSAMTTAAPAPSVYSDWGSPDGKLDWGIQGEELNKLRKSASFGFRNNQVNSGGLSSASAASGFTEPDLSWVQSLVKDGPATQAGLPGMNNMQKGYQINGGGDLNGAELFALWSDKDKIVA